MACGALGGSIERSAARLPLRGQHRHLTCFPFNRVANARGTRLGAAGVNSRTERRQRANGTTATKEERQPADAAERERLLACALILQTTFKFRC